MITPFVWSRHDSHRPIRLQDAARPVVVNFGNTGSCPSGHGSIVINPVEAVAICKNKIASKEKMRAIKVPTPQFGMKISSKLRFPIVVKRVEHSGGKGMQRIRSAKELQQFIENSGQGEGYYWERYVRFDREFRVHVSRNLRDEIFSTEKVLKVQGAWVRNLQTCKFMRTFKRPSSRRWKQMVHQCVRFLDSIGLDLGGFDVGYNNRQKKFYIIECNSACGMGDATRKAYTEELNRIIKLIAN